MHKYALSNKEKLFNIQNINAERDASTMFLIWSIRAAVALLAKIYSRGRLFL